MTRTTVCRVSFVTANFHHPECDGVPFVQVSFCLGGIEKSSTDARHKTLQEADPSRKYTREDSKQLAIRKGSGQVCDAEFSNSFQTEVEERLLVMFRSLSESEQNWLIEKLESQQLLHNPPN